MMTSLYKIENLENLLQCTICLERFQIPKVLECQHTFCLKCLQNIYDSQNQTLTCPTCQRNMKLTENLNELPNNILIINLMDIQPIKAKCSSCQKIEILTLCEYCNSPKCTNCNEKHVDDMRQSIKTTLEELENTNQNELKISIHNSFKVIRNEINNQFQNIRQQHDSHLLKKQIDILKKLESYEQNLLTQIEHDLRFLEQSKLEIIRNNVHINRKTESELINLLTIASDAQYHLTEKITQYVSYVNSLELSLQYDQSQTNEINQLCDSFQLNISDEDENSKLIYITLRTFLNQEYKLHIKLDKTINELKEIFGKQENIDPNKLIITKIDNYFNELDNNRTLKSYNCDSTSILMIYLRK
ncbi:unnamed protein product [Rotaria sordida]|uniref:RING-type domain-containing protein n=2 Tax=Rotaria sordida TaxID=392033 RepID=A0A814LWN9_9BILA|nr:unnamed protein product [Rotaria sordida]